MSKRLLHRLVLLGAVVAATVVLLLRPWQGEQEGGLPEGTQRNESARSKSEEHGRERLRADGADLVEQQTRSRARTEQVAGGASPAAGLLAESGSTGRRDILPGASGSLSPLSPEERRVQLLARRKGFVESTKKSPDDLLAELQAKWASGGQERNSVESQLALRALATSLGSLPENAASDVYRRIRELLSDPSLDQQPKLELMKALGSVQTVAAVDLLLDLCMTEPYTDLREAALKQIAGIDSVRFDNQFREELDPILRQAWLDAAQLQDVQLDQSLALAIARIGTQQGLMLLVAEACAGASTVQEMSSRETPRSVAAEGALAYARNPEAIPILGAMLRKAPSGSALEYEVGSTLAAMGKPDATRVLLNWALAAGPEHADACREWFSKMRDPQSHQLVRSALGDPGQYVFASAEIRTALVAVTSATEQ